MCHVFKVSRSGYYDWLNRKPSKRAMESQNLNKQIKSLYELSKGRSGSPKLTMELRDRGIYVSRPRVARMMKTMGIRSIISKKFRVVTTDSDHSYSISPNLLERDFYAERKGQKWVSDITYIRTLQGWLYLTIIMDLYDRKIIGWSMSHGMDAESTVIAAFKMAIKNRPVNPFALIFHSDRGIQYACNQFRAYLGRYNIIQSMSRKGNCWDNAVAENFFKIIKSEMVYHSIFRTKPEAKIAIFEFIEIWYNKKRKHSYLKYMTPEQFETLNQKIAA
jgi:transposase InsO family protein